MPIYTIYSDKRKPGWSYDQKQKKWRGYLLDVWKFDGRGKPLKRKRVQYSNKAFAEAIELEIEIEKKNASLGVYKAEDKNRITLKELFDRHASTYKRKQRINLATRVYADFLSLLPDEDFLVTDLRPSHFQTFVEKRTKEVQAKTVNHELGVITPALRSAYLYFPELEEYQPPTVKRIAGANRRRERLVTGDEQTRLLEYLRRERETDEADKSYFHRVRLADWIEFSAQTGFRRSDTAAIKKTSYDRREQALLDVWRHKQGKFTAYFPLTHRAAEIIEARLKLQPESEFIFTAGGLPIESNYRTLREVCAHLKIKYGKNIKGGFVLHDLKRNFSSLVQQVTDISTLRELTSNSSESLNVYLNTSKAQMRDAMRKMEGLDATAELKKIFERAKTGKITEEKFVESVYKLFR